MTYFFSILNGASVFGCLAALQVLLLKRMGLAFAAIPLFAGVGAYAFAASELSLAYSFALLLLAAATGVGFAWLSGRLSKDLFLLATLAFLELAGAAIGASSTLGGREGLPAPSWWEVGGNGFEQRMLVFNLGLLVFVVGLLRWVLNSAAGAAIDRLNENADSADRWFPKRKFESLAIITCCTMATIAGAFLPCVQRACESVNFFD